MTPVREERRLVTCMFIDVVGSTELTMTLGAERLKRELGAAFTELSAIIAAHGGTVEKYVGDAIYALFGAPVAHDDDALRALRAAEALRDWCAGGTGHSHPFAVRVGVETGEAVVDLEAAAGERQRMSVGPVVNIAARLQQRAEPGEVLVGPTAREATEGAAVVEPLGEAELKGLGRVALWRLVRVGAREAPRMAFVGREAELALLRIAYDRAAKGRSVLAVVSGPPGQGKTRLVQEFLDERLAGPNGPHLIATRCRPADETGVFAPLRQVLGVTTLEALAEQVGRLCADDLECERVVAGLAESAGIATSASLSRLPAAEREDEIVQAWRRYVGFLGADRLVVLAIDDLHWADPSLVRLVDRLTFGGPRLLLVATARPEFAEAAGIRPTGDRFFVELEGLDPEDARRLATDAGRADDRVVDRAEGNPLFIVELARARAGGDLPLTLQGALGARLDELSPDDRALLATAGVAGERFSAADAAFLARREPADTARALARLADLHYLDVSEAGYRFHHGLVRDVAYGRLLAEERMRAHARFARERVHPEDAAALAHHWWEALRPPDAEWIWADDPDVPAMRREAHRAQLAAGTAHAEHFAIDLALEILGRALQLASDDRERAAAEHALGKAYQGLLRQDEAWSHLLRALDLYRRSGDVPLDVHVDIARAAGYWGAFKRVPAEDEILRLMDEGAAAARAADDRRALALMLGARAQYVVNTRQSEPELAEPHIEAAMAAAEASGDAGALRGVLRLKQLHLATQGRLDERGPLLAELGRSMRDADALERLRHALGVSWHHFLMADLAAGDEAVAEAMALAEPMGPHNRTHAWAQATEMYAARGEWAKVVELAQRTARLVREEEASAFCSNAADILRDGAIAHALAGRREDALALIRGMSGTKGVEVEIVAQVPRALLGFPSPETDTKMEETRRGWWDWAAAAMRAVILRRPDDAERALVEMGRAAETSVAYRALAEAVREAVAELRGGAPATYDSLRRIGFTGWIDVLRRRVDAEY